LAKNKRKRTNFSFYYQMLLAVVVLHHIVSITSCAIKKTRKE